MQGVQRLLSCALGHAYGHAHGHAHRHAGRHAPVMCHGVVSCRRPAPATAVFMTDRPNILVCRCPDKKVFDAVVVCSGNNHSAKLPDFDGRAAFERAGGRVVHSAQYRDAAEFAGNN